MKWVSAFNYLPVNYGVQLARVADQTQRITFDNNLCGEKVRVRLSNYWSGSPLTICSMSVGIVEGSRVTSVRQVTKDQSKVITLAPGQESWSDEITLTVKAGDRIAISTYVDEMQSVESVCAFWSSTGPSVCLSSSGDYTNGDDFEGQPAETVYSVIADDVNKGYFFYGVSGLQVYTDDGVRTIAMFGDSITHMSYVSNALAKRLCAAYPGKAALINRGIGGNRLLHDATKVTFLPSDGACFGRAGMMRFEQDIFGEETVDAVLVLEGINDIMHPIQFDYPKECITAEELICGYRYLIAVARKHGAKIFGATITPCGHKMYPEHWLPKFEAVRRQVNDRIRSGIGFDGWFDYDAAVRNDDMPSYMRDDCHIDDGLHPNDPGGAMMAGQVDLEAIMGSGGADI
ncbi:MAG: hypothetical protein HFH75_12790 [Lachnospiraceae bacterium]|nr:hypothetical protein [Lachnospiraceae bacterium]